MTPGKAAAYIGGAVLLAAWLSSAATSLRQAEPPPASVPSPEATSGTDTLASEVQAQAARLRARLAAAPAPQKPARDPFSFAAIAPAGRPAVRATAPPEPASIEALEPTLSLIGVAEQQSAQGLVRTALIVGSSDELFMVVAGQEVAGGYRVTAVGADVVELQNLSTGALRRLALR